MAVHCVAPPRHTLSGCKVVLAYGFFGWHNAEELAKLGGLLERCRVAAKIIQETARSVPAACVKPRKKCVTYLC